MGSITSSVGLISGIDSGALIQQLLQIEARPKQLAQRRILQLQQKQAAFLSINSSLLALGTAAGKFRLDNIFQATSASSSNEDVLSATSSSRASEGTYRFQVDRLVSTQRAHHQHRQEHEQPRAESDADLLPVAALAPSHGRER